MKKFRVEFNNTGYYSGAGIWECVDEIGETEAEDAQEAIEIAIAWWAENAIDFETGENEANNFAWRAAEIEYDSYGFLKGYTWINRI